MSALVKKTISQKKAKSLAWEWFSKYVRIRDAIKTTKTKEYVMCVTCNRRYKAFGVGCAQAGHFIPGRNNSVLIDERFVNAQCPICNRWKKGEWVKYEKKMLERYGKEAVEEVKRRSGEVRFVSVDEWLDTAETYKDKFEKLKNTTLLFGS